jgi:serine/threonine-protein kinase
VESILRAPIPRPRSIEPGVPFALDAIVMRALEREPDQRFATALEMHLALDRAGLLPRAVELRPLLAGWLAELIGEDDPSGAQDNDAPSTRPLRRD